MLSLDPIQAIAPSPLDMATKHHQNVSEIEVGRSPQRRTDVLVAWSDPAMDQAGAAVAPRRQPWG
jgi:hypothetical protein